MRFDRLELVELSDQILLRVLVLPCCLENTEALSDSIGKTCIGNERITLFKLVCIVKV